MPMNRRALTFNMLLGLTALARPATALAASCLTADHTHELIYIGTHDTSKPRPPGGPAMPNTPLFAPDLRPGGKGIYGACFDERTGQLTPMGLAAEIERPTWLLTNPILPILYTVSEIGNNGKTEASVYSYKISAADGALTPINHVGSGGGGATHLAIDRTAHTLFVANFGGGKVSALPIHADGSLATVSSVQGNYGTGPKPRQQGPHAHGVTIDPTDHFLLSPDLGADRVFVYRFDKATQSLTPADPPFEATPPGTGPRHLVFLPNGKFAYLNTELAAEILVYRWDAGHLQPVQTMPLLRPDYTGEKSAAEIAVSKDGRFLYVSNRGEDTLVVFTIDQAHGTLSELQRIPAQGKTPWSFSIDPSGRWMIVDNEGSSTLNVVQVDPQTGRLTPTAQSMPVPKPVSVVFFPP